MISEKAAVFHESQGTLKKISIVTEAYQLIKDTDGLGKAGNVLHQCQRCKRVYDKFIVLEDGGAICEHCRGNVVLKEFAMIARDEVVNILKEINAETIVRESLRMAIINAFIKIGFQVSE